MPLSRLGLVALVANASLEAASALHRSLASDAPVDAEGDLAGAAAQAPASLLSLRAGEARLSELTGEGDWSAQAPELFHVEEWEEEPVEKVEKLEPGCECLNYTDVYDNRSVRCGDSFEVPGVTNCMFFYKRLNSNWCWNIPRKDMKKDEGQWCYVSLECKQLDGGARVGKAPVNWKRCREHRDPMTRFKSVKKLALWAKKHDFDLQDVLTLAYSRFYGQWWEQLKEYIEPGKRFNLTAMPEKWRTQIEDIMMYGPRTYFPTGSGQGAQAVIENFKVYYMTENKQWTHGKGWHDKYVHPFKMTQVVLKKEG
uniref:Uncharacterized protein n=1 Tax=Alexandrium andersonii TaxID=327968 RepID=A0A7S2AF45_9DINO|mmetsp:Transcript_102835/g.230923  ORF Transcript_102835/g.230923 Transcript_102835/m.230923 type:complete len:311 (+) Transcript_102835:83-1015(+)